MLHGVKSRKWLLSERCREGITLNMTSSCSYLYHTKSPVPSSSIPEVVSSVYFLALTHPTPAFFKSGLWVNRKHVALPFDVSIDNGFLKTPIFKVQSDFNSASLRAGSSWMVRIARWANFWQRVGCSVTLWLFWKDHPSVGKSVHRCRPGYQGVCIS